MARALSLVGPRVVSFVPPTVRRSFPKDEIQILVIVLLFQFVGEKYNRGNDLEALLLVFDTCHLGELNTSPLFHRSKRGSRTGACSNRET